MIRRFCILLILVRVTLGGWSKKISHMSPCDWVVEDCHNDQHVEDDARGGEEAGKDCDEERVAVVEDKFENLVPKSCVADLDAASLFETDKLILSGLTLNLLHLFQVIQAKWSGILSFWGCSFFLSRSAWLTRFGDQMSCYRFLSWPRARSQTWSTLTFCWGPSGCRGLDPSGGHTF